MRIDCLAGVTISVAAPPSHVDPINVQSRLLSMAIEPYKAQQKSTRQCQLAHVVPLCGFTAAFSQLRYLDSAAAAKAARCNVCPVNSESPLTKHNWLPNGIDKKLFSEVTLSGKRKSVNGVCFGRCSVVKPELGPSERSKRCPKTTVSTANRDRARSNRILDTRKVAIRSHGPRLETYAAPN